jgi:hypothetical protein
MRIDVNSSERKVISGVEEAKNKQHEYSRQKRQNAGIQVDATADAYSFRSCCTFPASVGRCQQTNFHKPGEQMDCEGLSRLLTSHFTGPVACYSCSCSMKLPLATITPSACAVTFASSISASPALCSSLTDSDRLLPQFCFSHVSYWNVVDVSVGSLNKARKNSTHYFNNCPLRGVTLAN